MNNTTRPVPIHHIDEFQQVQLVVLSIMLVACLFGNILVITAIVKTKKLRTPSNLLIVNLSVCDIMTAVCGIPFSGIIFNIYYGSLVYPFGKIVCKLLWPLTTYASTCSVFTLSAIAVERYLNIASVRTKFTKSRYVVTMVTLHVLALAAVVPYSVTLKYEVYKTQAYCYEEWSIWQRKVYTLFLCSIQYVLPLFIMVIFYLLAWRKLYAHNISMIKMTEEYERKMDWNAPYRKKTSECSTLSMPISKPPSGRGSSTSCEKDNSSYAYRSNIERKVARRRESGQRISQRRRSSTHTKANGRDSVNVDRRESKAPNRRRSQSVNVNGGRRISKDVRKNSVTTYKYTSRRQSKCGGSIVSIEKETYRRRTSTVSFPLVRNESNASIREMKKFNKSRYSSQAAFTRHMQTVRTLKMFIAVVVVFACFALPNQISWLLTDFSFGLPRMVSEIFIMLSHVSSVVNCWIYGSFHSGIRKAYIDTISCYFCRLRKMRRYNTNTSGTTNTTSSSLYDSMREEMFRRRMSSFNHIFEDQYDNFENIKHLYQAADNDVEEKCEKMDENLTDELFSEMEEIDEEYDDRDDIENVEYLGEAGYIDEEAMLSNEEFEQLQEDYI